MPCARKSKETGPEDLEKKILGLLKGASAPMGCGEVAKALHVQVAQVMAKFRSMKTKGLVESPEKGKYIITEEGRKQA